MLKRIVPFLGLSALLLTACTFSSQDNILKGEFHQPFTYPEWSLRHYTTDGHVHVCELSTGYNGLTISISKLHKYAEMISVHSNRPLAPGANLTIDANGQRFETSSVDLPPQEAASVVDTFSHGGKAYLEWAEFGRPFSSERSRVLNILKLDDFHVKLEQCRSSLRSKK